MDDRTELEELRARVAQLEAERAQRSAASRLLARRLRQFEAIVDTVPVGVVIADESGRIFHGNRIVEKMLRHPVLYSEDVDGYGEWVSFHEDGRRVQSEEYPLSRVLRDGESYSELDVNYRRGDGTFFWLRIIGRPILDEDGEVIGASVALVDIDEFLRLERQQKVLIGELNHRVKNAFTVVKSIVSQSLRNREVPESLRHTVDARLDAYSRAHSRLVGSEWQSADLNDIARDVVQQIAARQVEVSGPPVRIPSRQALTLSMAFYELTTNAVKYGALSVPEGRVRLAWDLQETGEGQEVALVWRELGGPAPVVSSSKGFGSFITGRAVALETQGAVETEFTDTGFVWRLTMPIPDKEETQEP